MEIFTGCLVSTAGVPHSHAGFDHRLDSYFLKRIGCLLAGLCNRLLSTSYHIYNVMGNVTKSIKVM